jgi:two-component system OmpR family response regulator
VRLLVIEDDADIRSVLVRGLTEEGFAVDQAADGEDGRFKAANPVYEAVILDLMLPRVDGLTVLRELRGQGVNTPVLVLTARDAVSERIRGLEGGADDYLVKPFSFGELLARVRALMRRARANFDPLLRLGALTLNQQTRRVHWGERAIDLSSREFAILQYFLMHPGQVLTRTRIYEHVWNETMELTSNVIDVYVKTIRQKLAATGAHELIRTVRGAGYRLEGRS